MSYKKLLTVAMCSTIAISALTACGAKQEEASPAATAADTQKPAATADADAGAKANMPEKPKELTIWPDDNADKLAVITELAKKYTEKTGIQVKITPTSMNNQKEALTLDGPSGKGPDLYYQPGIGDLVLKGLVQPIVADSQTLGAYTPESLAALSQGGKLYGLPAVIETYALFYNKKLLPEPPKTMADLAKIQQEKTNAAKQEYGFLFDATNFYFAWGFLGGSGGYIFQNDGKGGFNIGDIGLNKEGTVKGATLIQDWFKQGYLPKGINGDILGGLFTQGKVAAVINGPWAITDYKKQLGDDLAVAPIPTMDDGKHPTSFIGVKGWMLSKFSKSPEWASDLAAFLTNEENAKYYYQKTGEVPPVVKVLNDPELTSNPLVSGFSQQIQYGIPFPTVPELDAVWDPMANALKFISEGKDVQSTLNDAVQQVQDKIKMSGATDAK
ncbi:extracellular solute-binding protein [Paenibacillus athensensis]|uniref:Maltodextrin-binding protein n=1 Tax=Paenibacillus athensensis TaxID=1967502 RepID=A0A4Y8Q9H4_9BACL|nr:extracellular solute-binding protein [Paenibacillus athensensis]MCD1260327.1 extracellular solute-binding protein [Paenibacillus athensensis]